MLKDIKQPKLEGVALAISREKDELNKDVFFAYLINLQDKELENVLIRSNGYGENDGEKIQTTELRRFYDDVPAKSHLKIEPILEEALSLSNQYWVSFYVDKTLYDRKFVFVEGSVSEANFVQLPLIGEEGVLIK